MKTNYQQRVITVPRGQNIGYTVLNNLKQNGIYKFIDIKTINTERDLINKSNVVTLEYTVKP